MAVENFAAGTLIIPMQEAFQNNGMYLAYGLVYKLLTNGISVKWAIQPGKAYNGTDFTATTQDIQTLTPYVGQAYTGGPFIIDSSQAAAALPIITAWQAANPNTKVHRATSPFTAPIASTMSRKPRIAVEETNSGIMTGYLNAAKIPDSNGNAWPNSSPDILSATEIGNGAFFGYNQTDPCKQLVYDIFLSPHTSDSTWTNATNAAELDTFVKIGGMIHATCHSMSAIENFAGPFLTTAGFGAFANQGDAGSFTVDVPDYPSAQAVPTSGAVQALPGGSEQTWLHTSVTYLPSTQVLAHFTHNNLQYDFMVGGSYKGGTGAGKVVYEGGHQYSTALPYSTHFEGPYLRFVYDSIFFSVTKPRIVLQTIPRNIPAGSPTNVTFAVVNDGGSLANGLTLSVTLAPGVVYTPGSASIPPTTIVGQTLTWNAAALAGNTGPGTVLTFQAVVTPPGPGIQSVATYNATFSDSFNENYTLPNYCASINATPGAAPTIAKTPLNQSVNPNSPISWTITAGNNGTLALNNVVITDTLPAGLTFVSAVPAPTSVVPGPGGTTIITWTAPQIPASIPPLTPAGIVITLNALAPPATTGAFTDHVNMTGTDTTPASYSVDASAVAQVNNRPPTVTVINPNGGELICQGTTIEWTAQDPDGDTLTFTIQYSADGGSTFTTIATGLPGTCPPPGPPYCSYFWDTTALPSGSNYLVKIIASDGELTGEDVSNATFTIDNTPPAISWVFPTNGAFLTTTPVTVQASATDNVGIANVEFFYSTDGINFTSISTDTTASGTIYTDNWELAGLPGGAYILRATATDTCGKTTNADINVTADLPPTVNLLTPQAGDLVCPPGTTITWTASDPNGDTLTFTLQYSSNGGVTYTQIATGLTGNSYVWNTTGLTSGSNYFVKIIASDGLLTAEDSNGPFTIDNTPPDVSWVSPLNGALLTSSPTTLQAMVTDNVAVQQVQFQYSSDGVTFTNINGAVLSPTTDSIYTISWDFSALVGGQYYLRAIGTDTCGETNQSTIRVTADLPPTVDVLTPQPGDLVCPPGTTITWTATSPSGRPLTYTLSYSANGGATYTQIISGISGNSFVWNTTGLPSGSNYFVKVVASDGILMTESVSGPFTIDNTPPVVNFVTPNNGDLLTSSPATLEATATDNVGVQYVQFQYSSDGVTFTNIDGPVNTPSTDSIYSIDWNFASLPQGQYYLRAVGTDTCGETSEDTIRVTANIPPTVNLVSPNGGEVICPQGTTIIWTASDIQGAPLTFTLEYSADGGITYNLIANGIPGPCLPQCTYAWNTSGLPSGNNYLIRVTASDGISTASDVSNAPFTIDNTPPTVAWVSPANNALITTSPVTLEASATDNVGVTGVTFQYSNDGGLTYNTIGTDTVPFGNIYSVSWNFSALPGGTYLLKATAADGCNQTSSATITVTADLPPTVNLISPNGGEIVCKPGTIIQWTAADANGDPLTYSLLYSGNGGTSYSLIATGLTGTCPPPGPPYCSYVWNTSALPSGSNYLIKIVATDGILTAEDVSNSTFTIDNTPPSLTINSPLPGSFLVGTVTLSATATDNVSISGVTFEYSQDGGATFIPIGTVTAPFGSTYAIPWDTTMVPNGPVIIRVTAKDQCNNTTEQRVNATIDNTPPTVQIPSPPNGSTVNGTVPILVTASDNECLAKVDLYIDGVLVQSVTVPGGGKTSDFIYDWDTTQFPEGPHQVKAVATDCAGLTAETTNTYVVDNLPDHFQQLLVDGTLTIPPQKPDAEQIIAFDVVTEVAKISIFPTIDGTKLTVRGYADIGVTYSTDGPQEEHYAEFKVPFNALILYPDLPLDAKVEPVIFIEHKQWHLLDPRTIKKDIVLFVGIRQKTC